MKTKFNGFLTLLLAFVVQISFAQEKTVSGTVSDTSGILPGVSVLVKGANKGTETDFNGEYSIKAKKGDILVFSYLGYKKTEIKVSDSSKINVTLNEDSSELEEIVVLGYVSREKNSITGSVVQIKSAAINEVPLLSVDQALQGKVAGLVINTSSGTPGSTQDIRIRGVGSLSASNQPLFVVDGVPIIDQNFSGSDNISSLGALSALNNQDIESISVLKDASATSAYGARGSNGVIVITTKKGKSGDAKFSFSSAYGIQDYAVGQPTPLSAAQRETLWYDAVFNTYSTQFNFDRAGAQAWALQFFPQYNAWNDAGRPDNNWGEAVTNPTPITQNYTISASGGNEKSNFYASLGFNSTEALVIGSSFERINGVFNYQSRLTKKLKFTTNLNVSNTRQDGFLEQSAFFANPFLTRYFMPPTESPFNQDGTPNTEINTTVFNTIYLAENDIYQNDLTRSIANSSLEYSILDNLKFKTVFSIDYNLAAYKSYQNRIHGGSIDEGGSAQNSITRNFNWVSQNSLNYSKSIGDHNFDVTLLQEYQKNKSNFLTAFGENFPADGLINLDNVSANFGVGGNFTDWSNASYMGLLNYNYLGKYIFDATYRREGSSRFAEGKRFGDFYSFGLAWNIHKESFLTNLDFINELRLRGSFGVSGNSGIAINSYQALLGFNADYDSQGAVFPTGFGNPNLTWEKNQNYDLGIDFSLFNGRVSGDLAYFNRRTYDLLQNVPLSSTTGFTSVSSNVGEIINKGLEASINFNIIKSKDLNWSVSGNYATLSNEVSKLALDGNGDQITITTGTRRIEVGQPINSWYMRKWAGVDPANGDPLWYINGIDGDTTNNYNAAQVAYQGENATPTFTGGFGTHFDYKGFFLDLDFYFSGGNKVFEDWARYTKSNGRFSTLTFNGVTELLNSWTTPGQITDYPALRANSGDGNRAAFTSSRFLYEGDFLRLRNLVVGFNLPKEAVSKLGMDGISFNLRGTNLFTWVKDDRLKYDPEVRADGFTRLTSPPVKSVVLGINFQF